MNHIISFAIREQDTCKASCFLIMEFMVKNCEVCKKKHNNKRFCSRKCRGIWQSENLIGEFSPCWKGDKVGNGGIHDWVYRIKSRASESSCFQEDKTCKGRMEWSNISGKYKRDLKDWWVLCSSHHKRFDMTDETRKKISESRKGILPWHTGKHWSKETKQKISEGNKGKYHSEESKRKMSESQKIRRIHEKLKEQ